MATFSIHTDNQDHLDALMALAKAFKIKFTLTDSEPITSLSKEQKVAIDEGLDELDKGKSLSHEEVLKELKKQHPTYFK